jgi:hypothetical protein
MWTDTARAHHARAGLALPSDLTDAEWALLEPFFPPPSPGRAFAPIYLRGCGKATYLYKDWKLASTVARD